MATNCTYVAVATAADVPTLDVVSTPTVVFGTIIFVLTWILMARKLSWLPIGRTAGTLCGAVLVVVFGILGTDDAYLAINYETLALLFGTMIMTILLEREGFFGLVIRLLSWRCHTARALLVRVCIVTGVLAALVTNDTVCVFLTPIVAEMCHRHNLPYGPYLIALATSANVGSTLTPVGNPQNMIIASLSHLSYVTFVARIGLSTLVCMALNIVMLLVVYKNELAGRTLLSDPQHTGPDTAPRVLHVHIGAGGAGGGGGNTSINEAESHGAGAAAGAGAGAGVAAGAGAHHDDAPGVEMAKHSLPAADADGPKRALSSAPPAAAADTVVPAAAAAATAAGASAGAGASAAATGAPAVADGADMPTIVVHAKSRRKLLALVAVLIGTIAAFIGGANLGWASVAAACVMLCIDFCEPDRTLKDVDWGLLVFFSALFIVVRGFQLTGIPGSVWASSRSAIVLDSAGGLTLYVVLVVIGSNTVSNVPLVLLLSSAIPELPDPRAGWLLLSFISTVAGNFTLIGSVANLIVCERAKRWYTLTFSEYLRFGLPSTLVIVTIGTLILRGMLFI